jgi:exonuclease III
MNFNGLHFADVATIQEAKVDELKKVQKEEFSAAFQKLYDCAKAYIYANGAILNKKKVMFLPHVFDF